ncbi:MAG: tRNA lysidine(34) synthetase TilS [Hellea sp.]|nr:tRNA lysidine(34) synthetase TilS [Hellea sp.]
MLSAQKSRQILENLPSQRLAIAFSGGGDSTALVHLCRNRSPKPLVLIVDHALRAESDKESLRARDFARGHGLETKVLRWDHGPVKTGIQEKARNARYDLLGRACRKAGIKFLLTAHTRDDQAETLLMRYDRGTGWRGAAGMAKSSYGAVWPQLAKISLLRPLLEASREELRAYNAKHGLHWIEDPSNENRNFDRIRARDYLKDRPELTEHLVSTAADLRLGIKLENKHIRTCPTWVDAAGLIHAKTLPLKRLAELMLMAASGTGQAVNRKKLADFVQKLGEPGFKSATYASALCLKVQDEWIFGPDPSLHKGRHNKPSIQPITLAAGEETIWNGRFFVTASQDIVIKPVFDVLNQIDDRRPKLIPKIFADSLPAFLSPKGKILNIGWGHKKTVQAQSLVAQRLHHMLG